MMTNDEIQAALPEIAKKIDPAAMAIAQEMIDGVMGKTTARQAIEGAEVLAAAYPCMITLKDIAPVYVPEGYELHTDDPLIAPQHDRATKTFPNGSIIDLCLLLF